MNRMLITNPWAVRYLGRYNGYEICESCFTTRFIVDLNRNGGRPVKMTAGDDFWTVEDMDGNKLLGIPGNIGFEDALLIASDASCLQPIHVDESDNM